jgi:hypothetical protein
MSVDIKQKLIKEVQMMLGSGIVDLEPDPEHWEFVVQMALDRYRQRSSNALEESFIFLTIQADQAVYHLPSEVQEVRKIYRRSSGVGGSTGVGIDPFQQAFINNMYMIGGSGGMGSGGTGFLATYELSMQFQNQVGTMFGREVMFTWNPVNKKLTLHRKFTRGGEEILLWAYNDKPDAMIIQDRLAKPWIRDYAVAKAKVIIGEARSKFSQIAGPQGGSTLNGDAMKAEGLAELERLELEMTNLIDQSTGGYGFVIG